MQQQIPEYSTFEKLARAIMSEDQAVSLFTNALWRDGQYCPYCGHENLYRLIDRESYKCAACKLRFSIKVGTIFAESKLEISTWILAIGYLCFDQRISSSELARRLGLPQKTAWAMMERLRHASKTPSFREPKDRRPKPRSSPATDNGRPMPTGRAKVNGPSTPDPEPPRAVLRAINAWGGLRSAAVEDALKFLSSSINLGTGLDHPGDKWRAEDVLGKLHREGYRLDPIAIRKWAMRHSWDPGSARQLADVVKEINASSRK